MILIHSGDHKPCFESGAHGHEHDSAALLKECINVLSLFVPRGQKLFQQLQ